MLTTPTINSAGVSDPDADLIFGLKSGDEKALSGLMDRHMVSIHKMAYYMLGDQMAAEDVTQTVFLKTWENAGNWDAGRAKLLTWMRRVTRNACLDILKKKKPIYTDSVPELEDTSNSPFESLSESQQSERVEAALSKLTENQRMALTLSYYQSVPQREGAQIMDISESAYESLLVRARKALKVILTNENDGG
ncbi:sigma-70 family RNA polymerase sigma factor [Hellea balneolensis]|uniref:sigma-70 family RNA polymerase sigma factor n=1 Tax=Hellea balneolensis TaxID=287478 RepID=UPI0004257356|nr:sigma-70 family RNA polymerase sigma factor [Hellea balneolensis]